MLSLRTLFNKEDFTKPDGSVVVDLIRRSVSFFNVNSRVGNVYLATEDTVMRPDLIANYFYNDSSLVDLLLKYNGYSNPFAINVDDFFRVPDSTVLSKFGSKPSLTDLGQPRKKKSNSVFTPKSKKDKARVAYLLNQQNAAPPVPPNFALQDGVKVLENKIVFGADVTNIKKEDCPEPISRTKLKETLIKNRLAS